MFDSFVQKNLVIPAHAGIQATTAINEITEFTLGINDSQLLCHRLLDSGMRRNDVGVVSEL